MRRTGIHPSWRAMTTIAVGSICLAACGGTTDPGPDIPESPDDPPVASVELVPPVPTAATRVGGTVRLEALARSASGTPVRSPSFAWSSSDETVATADIDGTVTGRGLGEAEITARAGGQSATFTVTVIREDFRSVIASGVYSCGLMTDSRAYCWGGNGTGTLGDGTTYDVMPTPVPVAGDHAFQVLYSGTGATTCGVADDGVARCWGSGNNRELGRGSSPVDLCGDDGTTPCNKTPMPVDSEERFAWSGGLYKHSCALRSDGRAYCWGFNPGGQTGTDTGGSIFQNFPTPVETQLRFTDIDGGFNHSCGLDTDGTIYCWGSAAFGVKGPGGESGTSLAQIDQTLQFVDVASGGWHACGVTQAGEAYCWGRNNHGQLGAEGDDMCRNGTEPCSDEPVRVTGGHTFTAISAGFFHTCALTTSGEAYCWGANDAEGASGKLGDGTTVAESRMPVRVAGGHTFVSLDVGRFHACGVTADGAAYCWGWGENGQLGGPEAEDSAVPVRVFGPGAA